MNRVKDGARSKELVHDQPNALRPIHLIENEMPRTPSIVPFFIIRHNVRILDTWSDKKRILSSSYGPDK